MKRIFSNKKGVFGPVISMFMMVMIITIIAGMTFLFMSSLKDTTLDQMPSSNFYQRNETGWINTSIYRLNHSLALGFSDPVVVVASNASNVIITSGNFTVSSDGLIQNTSGNSNLYGAYINFSYTYNRITDLNAYEKVNDTEDAGATVVDYLPLVFLALIFGVILTVVLKVILPYMNIGNKMDGG